MTTLTNEEILEAAKEAGISFDPMVIDGIEYEYRYVRCNDSIGSDEADCIERFAEIIERKTIEHLSAGGVLVRISRPEGYEDVHPDLLVEDAIKDGWKWFDILTQQSAN